MYKDTSQLAIDQFIFPYGVSVDPDNRWVRMADLVPWDEVEKAYAEGFGKTGAPAHPARMALGALLVKQIIGIRAADDLTQDQLKLLFSLPDTGTRLGRRNRFFMIFAYEVGARMQEALCMKVCDAVFGEDTVRIRIEGKGSKVRYVPLLASAVGHLVAYLDEFHPLRAPDDYLFYTVHDGNKTQMHPGAVDASLKKYSAQAIEFDADFPANLHEHMLRRSIAMAMYKKGIPLSYIRDFLGHARVDSSRVYAYSDSETIMQALQAANSLIDGRNGQRLRNDEDCSEKLMEFCGLA